MFEFAALVAGNTDAGAAKPMASLLDLNKDYVAIQQDMLAFIAIAEQYRDRLAVEDQQLAAA